MASRDYWGWCDTEVGARIRKTRLERGLEQQQLAPPGQGITAAYLSLIESGKRHPALHIVEELAARLGTTRAYLCRGIEPGIREEFDKKLNQLTDSELQVLHGVANLLMDARIAAPETQLHVVAA